MEHISPVSKSTPIHSVALTWMSLSLSVILPAAFESLHGRCIPSASPNSNEDITLNSLKDTDICFERSEPFSVDQIDCAQFRAQLRRPEQRESNLLLLATIKGNHSGLQGIFRACVLLPSGEYTNLHLFNLLFEAIHQPNSDSNNASAHLASSDSCLDLAYETSRAEVTFLALDAHLNECLGDKFDRNALLQILRDIDTFRLSILTWKQHGASLDDLLPKPKLEKAKTPYVSFLSVFPCLGSSYFASHDHLSPKSLSSGLKPELPFSRDIAVALLRCALFPDSTSESRIFFSDLFVELLPLWCNSPDDDDDYHNTVISVGFALDLWKCDHVERMFQSLQPNSTPLQSYVKLLMKAASHPTYQHAFSNNETLSISEVLLCAKEGISLYKQLAIDLTTPIFEDALTHPAKFSELAGRLRSLQSNRVIFLDFITVLFSSEQRKQQVSLDILLNLSRADFASPLLPNLYDCIVKRLLALGSLVSTTEYALWTEQTSSILGLEYFRHKADPNLIEWLIRVRAVQVLDTASFNLWLDRFVATFPVDADSVYLKVVVEAFLALCTSPEVLISDVALQLRSSVWPDTVAVQLEHSAFDIITRSDSENLFRIAERLPAPAAPSLDPLGNNILCALCCEFAPKYSSVSDSIWSSENWELLLHPSWPRIFKLVRTKRVRTTVALKRTIEPIEQLYLRIKSCLKSKDISCPVARRIFRVRETVQRLFDLSQAIDWDAVLQSAGGSSIIDLVQNVESEIRLIDGKIEALSKFSPWLDHFPQSHIKLADNASADRYSNLRNAEHQPIHGISNKLDALLDASTTKLLRDMSSMNPSQAHFMTVAFSGISHIIGSTLRSVLVAWQSAATDLLKQLLARSLSLQTYSSLVLSPPNRPSGNLTVWLQGQLSYLSRITSVSLSQTQLDALCNDIQSVSAYMLLKRYRRSLELLPLRFPSISSDAFLIELIRVLGTEYSLTHRLLKDLTIRLPRISPSLLDFVDAVADVSTAPTIAWLAAESDTSFEKELSVLRTRPESSTMLPLISSCTSMWHSLEMIKMVGEDAACFADFARHLETISSQDESHQIVHVCSRDQVQDVVQNLDLIRDYISNVRTGTIGATFFERASEMSAGEFVIRCDFENEPNLIVHLADGRTFSHSDLIDLAARLTVANSQEDAALFLTVYKTASLALESIKSLHSAAHFSFLRPTNDSFEARLVSLGTFPDNPLSVLLSMEVSWSDHIKDILAEFHMLSFFTMRQLASLSWAALRSDRTLFSQVLSVLGDVTSGLPELHTRAWNDALIEEGLGIRLEAPLQSSVIWDGNAANVAATSTKLLEMNSTSIKLLRSLGRYLQATIELRPAGRMWASAPLRSNVLLVSPDHILDKATAANNWHVDLLQLYHGYTNKLPSRPEVLVCSDATTVEEISLLIQRSAWFPDCLSCCIACPDRLAPSIRGHLLKRLLNHQNSILVVLLDRAESAFRHLGPSLPLKSVDLTSSLNSLLGRRKVDATVVRAESSRSGKSRAVKQVVGPSASCVTYFRKTSISTFVEELQKLLYCQQLHFDLEVPEEDDEPPEATTTHYSDVLFELLVFGSIYDARGRIFELRGVKTAFELSAPTTLDPAPVKRPGAFFGPIQRLFEDLLPQLQVKFLSSSALDFSRLENQVANLSEEFYAIKAAILAFSSPARSLVAYKTLVYCLESLDRARIERQKQIHLSDAKAAERRIISLAYRRILDFCRTLASSEAALSWRALAVAPIPIIPPHSFEVRLILPANLESLGPLDLSVEDEKGRFDLRSFLSENATSLALRALAFTPDFARKACLLWTLLCAGNPVVLVGETGSGKSFLVRQMQQLLGVDVFILEVHGGLEERDIQNWMLKTNEMIKLAKKPRRTIVFFDEVNTTSASGIIKEIVCDRRCRGYALAENIMFIAACNPYRVRSLPENPRKLEALKRCGLVPTQVQLAESALQRLVYRIQPLPRALADHAFDLNQMSSQEEKRYIAQMLTNVDSPHLSHELMCEAVLLSQRFHREHGLDPDFAAVTLRDVNRFIKTLKWLLNVMKPSFHAPAAENPFLFSEFADARDVEVGALCISLAVVYYFRALRSDQQAYLTSLSNFLHLHANYFAFCKPESLLRFVQSCCLRVASCFEVEDDIVRTPTLCENIFLAFICVQTRQPLFVRHFVYHIAFVPAAHLRTTDRGRFPVVQPFWLQCSGETSAEAVHRCFLEATAFVKRSSHVLAVVVLEEIGLMEFNRTTPLKALHGILDETDRFDTPEHNRIAFVGISNWLLDPAKLNRGVYSLKEDIGIPELEQIVSSLFDPIAYRATVECKTFARALVRVFHRISTASAFWGLRDFYNAIRALVRLPLQATARDMLRSCLRHLGSYDSKSAFLVFSAFSELGYGSTLKLSSMDDSLPRAEKDWINFNLISPQSRHLLLIGSLPVIKQFVTSAVPKLTWIDPIAFAEDKSSVSRRNKLELIKSAMREGNTVSLSASDPIIECLYEVLNARYTLIGSKFYSRIAIGRFFESCEVDPRNFKIVLACTASDLSRVPPPLLNRLEKHWVDAKFTLFDLLGDEAALVARSCVLELERQLAIILAHFKHLHGHNLETDAIFFQYSSDFSPISLVYSALEQASAREDVVLQACIRSLLTTLTAVGQLLFSASATTNVPREVTEWRALLLDERAVPQRVDYAISSFFKCQKARDRWLTSQSNLLRALCFGIATGERPIPMEEQSGVIAYDIDISQFPRRKDFVKELSSLSYPADKRVLVIIRLPAGSFPIQSLHTITNIVEYECVKANVVVCVSLPIFGRSDVFHVPGWTSIFVSDNPSESDWPVQWRQRLDHRCSVGKFASLLSDLELEPLISAALPSLASCLFPSDLDTPVSSESINRRRLALQLLWETESSRATLRYHLRQLWSRSSEQFMPALLTEAKQHPLQSPSQLIARYLRRFTHSSLGWMLSLLNTNDGLCCLMRNAQFWRREKMLVELISFSLQSLRTRYWNEKPQLTFGFAHSYEATFPMSGALTSFILSIPKQEQAVDQLIAGAVGPSTNLECLPHPILADFISDICEAVAITDSRFRQWPQLLPFCVHTLCHHGQARTIGGVVKQLRSCTDLVRALIDLSRILPQAFPEDLPATTNLPLGLFVIELMQGAYAEMRNLDSTPVILSLLKKMQKVAVILGKQSFLGSQPTSSQRTEFVDGLDSLRNCIAYADMIFLQHLAFETAGLPSLNTDLDLFPENPLSWQKLTQMRRALMQLVNSSQNSDVLAASNNFLHHFLLRNWSQLLCDSFNASDSTAEDIAYSFFDVEEDGLLSLPPPTIFALIRRMFNAASPETASNFWKTLSDVFRLIVTDDSVKTRACVRLADVIHAALDSSSLDELQQIVLRGVGVGPYDLMHWIAAARCFIQKSFRDPAARNQIWRLLPDLLRAAGDDQCTAMFVFFLKESFRCNQDPFQVVQSQLQLRQFAEAVGVISPDLQQSRPCFAAIQPQYDLFEASLSQGNVQVPLRPAFPVAWILSAVLRLVVYQQNSTAEYRNGILHDLENFVSSGRWNFGAAERTFLNHICSPDIAAGASADQRIRSLIRLCPRVAGVTTQMWLFNLSVWSIVSSIPQTNLLGLCFSQPAELLRGFVPAFSPRPDIARDPAITQYWRHSCGFLYGIADCGRPMQATRCPRCGNGDIGGNNHAPAPGNVVAQLDEIIAHSRGLALDGSPVIRGLNSRDTSLLRILMISSMMGSLILRTEPNFPLSPQMQIDLWNEWLRCCGSFSENFSIPLNQGLEIIENELSRADFVNTFAIQPNDIASPERREAWETRWKNAVSHYLIGCREAHRQAIALLEQARPDTEASRYIRGLITTANLTDLRLKSSLVNYFYPSGRYSSFLEAFVGFKDRWPLIQTVIDAPPMLLQAHLLPKAFRFLQNISSLGSFKLSEAEASSTEILLFINSISDRQSREVLVDQFNAFKLLWNQNREQCRQFQCEAVTIPELTDTSPVSLCVHGEESPGSRLAQMILGFVCDQHNTLLGYILETCQRLQRQHLVPLIEARGPNDGERVVISLADAIPSDLLGCRNLEICLEDAISDNFDPRTEQPFWDFAAIEQQLLLSIFLSKKRVQCDYLPAFHFKANATSVLMHFPNVVPQIALEKGASPPVLCFSFLNSHKYSHAAQLDRLSRTSLALRPSMVELLQNAVEIAMNVLVSRKLSMPQLKFLDFIQDSDFLQLQIDPEARQYLFDVKLCHLVALHKHIKELFGEVEEVMPVPAEYCASLGDLLPKVESFCSTLPQAAAKALEAAFEQVCRNCPSGAEAASSRLEDWISVALEEIADENVTQEILRNWPEGLRLAHLSEAFGVLKKSLK